MSLKSNKNDVSYDELNKIINPFMIIIMIL